MAAPLHSEPPAPSRGKTANLMVRLDPSSKGLVTRAARARGVSASDYVRQVVVTQAGRDLAEASTRTIVLSPADQYAFWRALQEPVKLTARQQKLGRIMRGGR